MPGKNKGETQQKSISPAAKIGELATLDVVSVPQTTNILSAVRTMTGHWFRRLPVTDAGTGNLRGIVTAGDILNLLGGGEKYNLVKVRHKGRILAALNEPVREIMTTHLLTANPDSTAKDVVEMMIKKQCGGIPLVDDDNLLCGILTEWDMLRAISVRDTTHCVADVMTPSPQVISPEDTLQTATHEMVHNKFRRLPVVSGDVLFGMLTVMDVIRFIGDGAMFEEMVTGDAADLMNKPVGDLVDGHLYTTRPGEGIQEIAQKMLEKNVGSLPVIEDSRLVGIVTEFDLLRACARF